MGRGGFSQGRGICVHRCASVVDGCIALLPVGSFDAPRKARGCSAALAASSLMNCSACGFHWSSRPCFTAMSASWQKVSARTAVSMSQESLHVGIALRADAEDSQRDLVRRRGRSRGTEHGGRHEPRRGPAGQHGFEEGAASGADNSSGLHGVVSVSVIVRLIGAGSVRIGHFASDATQSDCIARKVTARFPDSILQFRQASLSQVSRA